MAASNLGSSRGPVHPTLSAECRERMVLVRISLITNYAFFGIIGAQLQLVEDNIHCQTLATDGKHLFYNVNFVMGCGKTGKDLTEYKNELIAAFPQATPEQINDAVNGLTDDELRAGIVHEILHCMMMHFIRQHGRQHAKWNKACDFAINQIIKREKLGTLRSSWLYDVKYEGMAAEEIYPLLEDDDEDGDSMDHHYSPGQGGSGDSDEDGNDRGTVGSLFGHASDAEINESIEGFKQIVAAAAQMSDVPAGLKRMFDDLQEPKIDWRTKVKRTLQSWMKHDMAFNRPSRRSWALGCVLPGYIPQEDIDICIALDMSGSITDAMARDMITEVYGMMGQFPSFKIRLMTFDTRVYNPVDFDENNINDILSYDVKGGGGTEFMAVWDHMKADEYRPKQLIMFTDGYPCGSWGDEDYCDTLFVIHGTTTIKSPFGATVYYEFSEE